MFFRVQTLAAVSPDGVDFIEFPFPKTEDIGFDAYFLGRLPDFVSFELLQIFHLFCLANTCRASNILWGKEDAPTILALAIVGAIRHYAAMKTAQDFNFGFTRTKIYELITDHCSAGSRVLEYSCGDGKLSAALQDVGYDVTGTNYSAYVDPDRSVNIVNGVDLTAQTPFEDESFDCVILSETIQNIPDHLAVYKEIERVLKKGGLFILTTPNMMNIKSRIHFFLTGFFKVKWQFIGFDVPLENCFAYHNHPVHLPVALYYFHALNMEPVAVDGIYPKAKSYLFYLLFAWLIIPFTWLTTQKKEKNLVNSGAGDEVFQAMTAKTTLCCDRLALAVRKRETAFAQESTTILPDWNKKH